MFVRTRPVSIPNATNRRSTRSVIDQWFFVDNSLTKPWRKFLQNFARNYLENHRLTDAPSFFKRPVHMIVHDCVYFVCRCIYIRVGGLPISPVCSWSKAESRFCSPCHSVSTLVKGLLGESNTLRSLRFSSLLYIRKKETVDGVL